jgi:replicative DNA helicase
MLSPHAKARLLPILRDDDFYYWQNQHVYNAIRDLHAQGRHVDPITVHGRLREKGQLRFGERDAGVYLADCVEAAYSPGFAHDYAADVLDAASRRRLQQAGLRVTQRASNPIGDTAELVEDALQQLADVQTTLHRKEALLRPASTASRDIDL